MSIGCNSDDKAMDKNSKYLFAVIQ